jgi:flagellar M-ring protein FliF
MGGFIEKIKNWWLESNPTQKYTTLGGIALTLILLVGIFSVASRPKYALLYGGLSQTDQAAIVTDIQAQGVPVKYDVPGQVEVPTDKIPELRMRLATSGKVPKSAHLGEENLGSMNLWDTPAVERARLKAIAEGEVATSIETNPGVRSAQVHITLGDPSPFSEQQRPPTASVSLVTTGNGAVSREAARGIAMLVANSVDGLDMKHVVVLDERSQALYNGSDLEGTESLAANKLDMEQSRARKEEIRLQGVLDRIYGAGSTTVSVRCEVDMDEKHIKKNERNVKKGAVNKSMKESMSGGASSAGGPSGAELNLQPAATGDKGSENYVSEVTQSEPNITETLTESSPAVGSLKSMTINVAADSREDRFGDPEKLQSLKDFIAAEVANKDKKMFVATVTPMLFDESTKVQIAQAQGEAASSARLQQILSLLPILALVAVGIMVVKQLGKMSKPTTTTVMTADGQMIQVPMVNGQIPSNYAMASSEHDFSDQGGHHHQGQGMEGQDPNTALSRYSNSELAGMGEDGIIYTDNSEVVEVEKIRERKSVHLAAIKQMAKDRPEPTAMLIKTWLAESNTR